MTRLPRPRLRAFPAAALPVGVLTLLLTVAAPAAADTYTVWSCRGPDGEALSAAAWHGAGATDTCATGGSLGAEVHGTGTEGAVFLPPPGTQIAGYRVNLSATTHASLLHDAGLQAGIALGGLLGTPHVVAGCPDEGCVFGDPHDPLGAGGLVERTSPPEPDALALLASCTHHWTGGCVPGDDAHGEPAASAQLWRSAVDLLDAAPPEIGAPGGSLLAGPVAGRATLAVPVHDAGGGVAAADLLVDGTITGTVRPGGGCEEPFTLPAPCPADVPVRFELDAATLAPGVHHALVRARDASGAATELGPIPFTVATPAAAPAGEVAAVVIPSPPAALATAGVTVERRRVAPGGTVRGSVRLAAGGPAPGAQLVVAAHRFGPGDPPERIAGRAVTNADGSFSVPAGLTARALVVRLEDPAYRPAQSLPVRVAGPLRIDAAPRPDRLRNGQVLTLQVQIRGAGPGAAALRQVLVQALVGGRWSTVDSVEARADGRATWRYRFRRTLRPARYLFRLRIPAGAEDWPFPTTVSRVVRVTVRP